MRPQTPALGCDIGGSSIKLVRIGAAGPEESERLDPRGHAAAGDLVAAIAATLARLAAGEGERRAPPPELTVGVAVPGFLDAGRRSVVFLSSLPILDGVPLAEVLEVALQEALEGPVRPAVGQRPEPASRARRACRIVLDTDTNAGAVGEARLGAARGCRRLLYVSLGTGLGAALAVDGEPVRVSRHTVGQVAHLPLEEASPDCYCGGRGCAETLLSSRGILWTAAQLGVAAESPAELARRAAQESAARQAWALAGRRLGRLLVSLCALFSPDTVVVGGGIAGAGELLLGPARQTLEERLRPRLGPPPALLGAGLGPLAGAIGAALLGAGPAGPWGEMATEGGSDRPTS